MIAAAIFLVSGAPGMVLAQTGTAAGYRKLDDINVVTSSGEKIGEVDEVLINASGQVVAVVIDLSGSFEEVIIGLDKLRFENSQFATALTKEQIQALPKWDD
jgi:hypothetical protein